MDTNNGALSPPNDTAIRASGKLPGPSPSALQKVFFGADGLRAIWSILIYFTLFAVLGFALNTVIRTLFPAAPKPGATGNAIPLKFGLIGESLQFLAVLLVTWIMSKIERRPNSVYGLGRNRILPLFFSGLAWGVVCLSLLIFALWISGFLVFDGRLIFGSDTYRYGALWLLGFLFVGLFEEYLTRGYLQYTLTRGLAGFYKWAFKTPHSAALGFWTAALVFSILFGLSHGSNPGESPLGLLAAGLVAMVFCLSLWRTGSLWWAIGFHTSWDWAQSFLYGVADSGLMVQHHLQATHPVGKPILSGGATGPEGSIIMLGIMAILILIILFTIPSANGGYAANLPSHRPDDTQQIAA
jgi:membrane protease YdiL (CAAX protease family)